MKVLTKEPRNQSPRIHHCLPVESKRRVNIAFLYFTSFDTVCILFWFQYPHPPFPHFFIRFSFFVKIHLLESSQLELKGYPPPLSSFFLSDFAPLFTASTSPRQRPFGEGILLSYGRILPRLRCSCLLIFLTAGT